MPRNDVDDASSFHLRSTKAQYSVLWSWQLQADVPNDTSRLRVSVSHLPLPVRSDHTPSWSACRDTLTSNERNHRKWFYWSPVGIFIDQFTFIVLFLYECETWSLALREEHRLRSFENNVLRGILGPKREKWREAEEDCIMRSFIRGCVQKFPDWPLGARTANGAALCH
jgi:hypothetical protein